MPAKRSQLFGFRYVTKSEFATSSEPVLKTSSKASALQGGPDRQGTMA